MNINSKAWLLGLIAVSFSVSPNAQAQRSSQSASSPLFAIPGYCAAPRWQPRGDRLACAGGDASGWRLEIRGPTGTAVGSIPGVQTTWAWSPDGQHIAASVPAGTNQYAVVVFDADGSNRREVTTSPESSVSSITWGGDGTQIYYTRRNPRSQEERVVVPASGGSVQPTPYARPAYSPDGRTIAYRRVAGTNVEIVLRDATANTERVAGTFAGFAATWGPTWSPDGRSIAVAGTLADGAGHVAVLDTTNATATFREINDVTGDAFAWAPDGTEIATSVFDGPAPRAGGGTRRMNLVAVNATTNRRRVLVRADRGACRAYQPTWSATGLGFVHQCAPPAATETRVIRLR